MAACFRDDDPTLFDDLPSSYRNVLHSTLKGSPEGEGFRPIE
jgi:hypothetical protein